MDSVNFLHILVIEDDPDHGLFTKIILERTGRNYKVDIAETPQEGLRRILDNNYDLVLSDYRMPGLNALDVLNETRKQGKDVPFIVVTASGNEKAAVELMKAGAYDYIIKDLSYKDTLPLVVERSYAVYRSRKEKDGLENKLIKAAEEWEATFNSIHDSIAIKDTDFTILRANKSLGRVFNCNPKEIKGKKCYEVVHNSSSPLQECPCQETIKDKKTHTREFFHPGLNIYFEETTSPVLDDRGSLVQIVHVLRDITDRKKAEEEIKKAYRQLKQTQNKLVQSEKLAALGRFSSGIAHEVKNPLGVILSGTEFLEVFSDESPEEVRIGLSKIKEATLRADTIIRNLLKFARPSDVTAKRVNPEVIVEETLSLIQYRVPANNIKIVKDYSQDKMFIKVDKSQLEQVMFNLVANAIEAMPEGGVLSVKIYKAAFSDLIPDKEVCVIETSDTGEGISKEGLSRICEPFYTTKRERKGTGLGLYMSKIIVNNHEGELLIRSQVGKGTTAKIIIPLAEDE
jgi:PAS domain S-box-containing protein